MIKKTLIRYLGILIINVYLISDLFSCCSASLILDENKGENNTTRTLQYIYDQFIKYKNSEPESEERSRLQEYLLPFIRPLNFKRFELFSYHLTNNYYERSTFVIHSSDLKKIKFSKLPDATTINQDNLFQYYGRIKIYAIPDLLAFSTGLAIDNRTVLTHLTPLVLKDVKVKSVTFSLYDPRMKKFGQPIDVEMVIAADTSQSSIYDIYLLQLKHSIDTLEKFNFPIHSFVPDNYFFYNFSEAENLKQIKIKVNPHDEPDEKFMFFDAESVFVKSMGAPLLTKIDNHFFLTGIYIGIRSSNVYPYRENCGFALKISDAIQDEIALMRKVSLLKWHELAETGDIQAQTHLKMFYTQGEGLNQV